MIRSRLMVVGVASATLAACTQERVEIIRPPVALTECADEPTAPDLPPIAWGALSEEIAKPAPDGEWLMTLFLELREDQRKRDRLTLDYILGLRSAYGDCKADVAGIKAWSEGLGR